MEGGGGGEGQQRIGQEGLGGGEGKGGMEVLGCKTSIRIAVETPGICGQ